jgi:hypothetical protein
LTLPESIYAAVGGGFCTAAYHFYQKFVETRRQRERPLYENGQRDQIVKMLRRIDARCASLEKSFDEANSLIDSRLNTLEVAKEENYRFQLQIDKLIRRVTSLEIR